MTAAFLLFIAFPFGGPSPNNVPGDAEFARMDYRGATAIYDSLLREHPSSAGPLWRLARAYVCLGDMGEQDQRESLYRKAEEYARMCIRTDSTCAQGHTWLAATLGNIAMFEGSKAKVKLCVEIKRELDLAVLLDPDDDVAYSIMGSFYLALGNVSWLERQLANIFLGSLPDGGYAESEAALKKAIALAPTVIRHQFELGLLYVDSDRKPEALEAFTRVESLPVMLASDARTKSSARDWVARLRD